MSFALFITLKLLQAMVRDKEQWYEITKNEILPESPITPNIFSSNLEELEYQSWREVVHPPPPMRWYWTSNVALHTTTVCVV